jgi:hypothetical protein
VVRLSFRLSFHQALLGHTGAHWLDEAPDVSCKDSTRQYAVDDPLLSCKWVLRRRLGGWRLSWPGAADDLPPSGPARRRPFDGFTSRAVCWVQGTPALAKHLSLLEALSAAGCETRRLP